MTDLRAAAFSANGEYLMIGQRDGVGVWRDDLIAARLPAISVQCLAISQDGRWIAAGTWIGHVYVWNATTHEQVFKHIGGHTIRGVDFSLDSVSLVSASEDCAATICDLNAREPTQTLHHEQPVWAAKYSPRGDHIATATRDHIRVWNSRNGRSLVEMSVKVAPCYNTGLLWFDRLLFVISDDKIKMLESSTGSTVSEWSVPDTDFYPSIALPKHGAWIVYSTKRSLSFWDTSTHSQIRKIQCHEDIRSVSIPPDDRSIAICTQDGKIIIESLSRTGINIDPIPLFPLDSATQEPILLIDPASLDAWKHNQLEHAESLLTTAIATSRIPNHHVLASRALIRARLQKWDASLVDAEMAMTSHPSAVGSIAKSLAYIGSGQKYKAYRACDIAFKHINSSQVTFLLLIKAIVVFMAGEHADAISRTDDLIATVSESSSLECVVVQAYMHLLIGNLHMESSNYDDAIESFEQARAKLRPHANVSFLLISLISGWKLDDFAITTNRSLCEALYSAGRVMDAVETFLQLTRELGEETGFPDEHHQWALDFSQRSFTKLGHLGDTAADASRHDEAISYYSVALLLHPPTPQDVLIKRSKAYLANGSWEKALDDANRAIALDPSSPWGYEMMHAGLHKAGNYENAVVALEGMLSRIEQSPDVEVQRLGCRYIRPSNTRATIHKFVHKITSHLPRQLVNTTDGRLYDRAEMEFAFESSRIFQELVSSTVTRIDYVRIKREVRQYFQYVMLSHKWELDEPLFQQVMHISVYDLDPSPTHEKLQTFCKTARDRGYMWAWSDTCCINKSDHFVLQEALVAMFKWYEGSALTIVYLRGVSSLSPIGALMRSIWNTRAWTLQEYVAAKNVLFYTEDWTLYLDLQLQNHKESREVISEMKEATGMSAEEMMALRPGLGSIREKLRLASTRKTTLVEDEAYSLLGIFSASGIPTIYGEREGAFGRLLANILTRSGDVGVLAWTGESGPFNSGLPAHVSVYNGPATSHLPAGPSDTGMDTIITSSHTSPFDFDAALILYDRLRDLPTPKFAESRMTLACITFQLPRFSLHRIIRSIRVYRAETDPFGMVEVRTRYDLTRFGTLYLVHPWLGSLLECEDAHRGAFEEDDVLPPSPNPSNEDTDDHEIDDEAMDEEAIEGAEYNNSSSLPEPPSLSLASTVQTETPAMDEETRARRFIARVRQPFGALLFRPISTDLRVYKRVAADSMLKVQFCEDFPLAQILDRVRTIDVL